MSEQKRADLGRWEISSTRYSEREYPGEAFHPSTPWEHVLYFPDLQEWFWGDEPPEFWGELTTADLNGWVLRLTCIVSLVAGYLEDFTTPYRAEGRVFKDTIRVNYTEGPTVSFMTATKDKGRALMGELVTRAETALDEPRGGPQLLADIVRAERIAKGRAA